MAILTNIREALKYLSGTITLAYCLAASMMKKKSSVTLTSGAKVIKLFTFSLAH
jgi:hypothetical protein